MAIHAAAPSPRFSLQRDSISDSATTQALPRKETDRDLRLVQPTAMLGRVMDREAVPDRAAPLGVCVTIGFRGL